MIKYSGAHPIFGLMHILTPWEHHTEFRDIVSESVINNVICSVFWCTHEVSLLSADSYLTTFELHNYSHKFPVPASKTKLPTPVLVSEYEVGNLTLRTSVIGQTV
jgi:hypothetical protein